MVHLDNCEAAAARTEGESLPAQKKQVRLAVHRAALSDTQTNKGADGTFAADAPQADKGFGLLEWTGTLIPQGMLVKGTERKLPCTLLWQAGCCTAPDLNAQQ